jgi:hypothetical protein
MRSDYYNVLRFDRSPRIHLRVSSCTLKMQVAGVFEMLKNSDYTASLSENICFESQPETQSFQFRILRPLEFRYIRQSDPLNISQ